MGPALSTLIAQLAESLPPGALLTDPGDTAPYLTDWRGLFRGDALCVVRPGNVAEVARAVSLARAHAVAVVPQGGNTGLAGGATPLRGRPQIVLSLTRMSAVRRIDRVGMTIEVEAGCVLERARNAAAEVGRLLPISFASQGSALIGGMISTNAGGINAIRYGTARQLVLGIEAVMADGSIVSALRALRKDNAGYDWKQVLIGSEGTLGIVTAAVLRLAPLPRDRHAAFVALQSPRAALRLLERCQDDLGEAINAFELMSFASVDRVIRHVGGRLPVEVRPWFVLIEVADSAGGLAERLQATLAGATESGDIEDAALASTPSQLSQLWALRENMAESERLAGNGAKHDVAVAVSDVPAFLEVAEAAVRELSAHLEVNAFGHLGDGNIHFNVLIHDDAVAAGEVNRVVHDVVARFDGSIAAEHGIGQYRVGELLRLRSPQEIDTMRKLKRAFDPEGVLNPGKVLPPEST